MIKALAISKRILNYAARARNLHHLSMFNYRVQRYTYSNGKDKLDQSKQNQRQKIQEKIQNSYNQEKTYNSFTYSMIAVSFFAVFGILFYHYQKKFKTQSPKQSQNAMKNRQLQPGKSRIGGEWELIDTRGNKFGSCDLKGSNYLIYFGFTKCPDICPNTLSYLSSLLRIAKTLPGYNETPIRLVFVSVDPARDTPQIIGKYLSTFGRDIIGVTGKSQSDERWIKCKKDFKIYANKVYFSQRDDIKQQNSYNVDHTTVVYLMDQENNIVDILNPSLNQKQGAKVILEQLRANKASKK